MSIWSSFGRRWAALPSASTALSALGVSSFIQTLLDDADAATARTTLGAVGTADIREKLTGNRTYYVRKDGSDSNNGLADTAGGAFLTIQKAVNVAATIDLAGFVITIQVRGSGVTYSESVTLRALVGGPAIIVGDETTPSNITVSSGTCFSADGNFSDWAVRGFKLVATVHGLSCQNGAIVRFRNVEFGAITFYGVLITNGSVVCEGNYTISGSCNTHINMFLGSSMQCQSRTVTITGTPAWGSNFISMTTGSVAQMGGNTYSGAATGKRFTVNGNSSVSTSGAGINYFPGNVAGTTTSDNEYI